VVNCILASYPTAVFERDNSGCTPMDILNGTGRIMDHDSVIAALNRTMEFLSKEENVFHWKMSQLESKLKDETEEQCAKYEDIIYKKDEEIAELKRQLQQEKLATNNLASKVIQSEKIVQQKVATEKSHLDILEKMEGELLDLNAANSSRKTKITELEDIIESDRKTIMDLTEVIETLRSQLTTICEEEERFVADNLVKAEANLKAMFEHQYVFLKETEKRKELMRERLSTLGISLSASLSEDDEEEAVEEEGEEECVEEEEEETEEESVDEPSDYEVARVALVSAMHAVQPFIQHSEEEDSLVEGVLGTFSREE
jgi:chromosome segregation ATPase